MDLPPTHIEPQAGVKLHHHTKPHPVWTLTGRTLAAIYPKSADLDDGWRHRAWEIANQTPLLYIREECMAGFVVVD